MYVLRATAKLLKRLGTVESEPAPSTTRLGDWYANLIHLGRAQLILCVSSTTLLPVLLPAREAATLPERLRAALAEVLRQLGVPGSSIEAELALMSSTQLARTASRQVLGTMNDFAFLLEAFLGPNDSLMQATLRLANVPCGPIGMDAPRDRAQAALAAPRLHVAH